MHVRVLGSTVSDNWFYLVTHGDEALLVDPIDAALAVDAVGASGVRKVTVACTHWHFDHTGGNTAVHRALGCEVLVPRRAVDRGVFGTQAVDPGHTLRLGDREVRWLDAPGHTVDHVILEVDGHWFSGDVLFVGGIGHCRLGGDVRQSFATIRDVVLRAPDQTRFYPGHDYVPTQLAFSASILGPDAVDRWPEAMRAPRDRSAGPWLHTLGDERRINLFLRCDEPAVRDAIERAAQHSLAGHWPDVEGLLPAERAFVLLRRLRDRYQ